MVSLKWKTWLHLGKVEAVLVRSQIKLIIESLQIVCLSLELHIRMLPRHLHQLALRRMLSWQCLIPTQMALTTAEIPACRATIMPVLQGWIPQCITEVLNHLIVPEYLCQKACHVGRVLTSSIGHIHLLIPHLLRHHIIIHIWSRTTI